MDFRRRMSWIRVALGSSLAIGVPWRPQRRTRIQRAGTAEPYTPAPDAKDLKAVLFNWMWDMGMLKGHDERDMVAIARISGQGHDSGGRAAVHADEISREHQLPDVQPADSVHLHARERTNVLEHRGRQRAVRLERRHARRGDRSQRRARPRRCRRPCRSG